MPCSYVHRLARGPGGGHLILEVRGSNMFLNGVVLVAYRRGGGGGEVALVRGRASIGDTKTPA